MLIPVRGDKTCGDKDQKGRDRAGPKPQWKTSSLKLSGSEKPYYSQQKVWVCWVWGGLGNLRRNMGNAT
jgi:hypothetical protein